MPDQHDIPLPLQQLQTRLREALPGREAQERMTGRVRPMPDVVPADARPSAVLALVFPVEEELHLLFMRRTEDGRAHSGQISFPGGRQEPSDADLAATALREAQEEVGIVSGDVTILGALTPLYIPVSNFQVYPFVGYSAGRPLYNISQREVAGVLEIPVSHLWMPESKITTRVRPASMPDVVLTVPAYSLPDGTFIWGATAMILAELEAVWDNLKGENNLKS